MKEQMLLINLDMDRLLILILNLFLHRHMSKVISEFKKKHTKQELRVFMLMPINVMKKMYIIQRSLFHP